MVSCYSQIEIYPCSPIYVDWKILIFRFWYVKRQRQKSAILFYLRQSQSQNLKINDLSQKLTLASLPTTHFFLIAEAQTEQL